MLAAIPLSNMPNHRDKLVLAADLLDTFVSGLEGAMAAIAANLDLLWNPGARLRHGPGRRHHRDLLIGAIPSGGIGICRTALGIDAYWRSRFRVSSCRLLWTNCVS